MALFYSVTVLHVQVWTYEIILQFGSKILSVLENTSNLVNKLFDKLKVLRADTLWAVDQKHQVDVCRLAGWRRMRQTKDGRFNYLIYFTLKNMIKEIKTWNTKQTLQHKYHSKNMWHESVQWAELQSLLVTFQKWSYSVCVEVKLWSWMYNHWILHRVYILLLGRRMLLSSQFMSVRKLDKYKLIK